MITFPRVKKFGETVWVTTHTCWKVRNYHSSTWRKHQVRIKLDAEINIFILTYGCLSDCSFLLNILTRNTRISKDMHGYGIFQVYLIGSNPVAPKRVICIQLPWEAISSGALGCREGSITTPRIMLWLGVGGFSTYLREVEGALQTPLSKPLWQLKRKLDLKQLPVYDCKSKVFKKFLQRHGKLCRAVWKSPCTLWKLAGKWKSILHSSAIFGIRLLLPPLLCTQCFQFLWRRWGSTGLNTNDSFVCHVTD